MNTAATSAAWALCRGRRKHWGGGEGGGLLVDPGIKVADTQLVVPALPLSSKGGSSATPKKQHCLNPSAVLKVGIILNLT